MIAERYYLGGARFMRISRVAMQVTKGKVNSGSVEHCTLFWRKRVCIHLNDLREQQRRKYSKPMGPARLQSIEEVSFRHAIEARL